MYTYIHTHKFSNNNCILGRAAGRAGSPHAIWQNWGLSHVKKDDTLH